MTSAVSESRPVDAAGPEGQRHTAARLIYFSSASGYTHRFVTKLDLPEGETARLPLMTKDPTLLATVPFVLAVPTYGGGDGRGAVPKQVIKFLNVKANRDLLRGVLAAGNTNFYEAYCLAGNIISRKCEVPVLYRFELMGTPEDVTAVREGLEGFWR